MPGPIDLGLVSLYHALDPSEIDVNQLGTPAQADAFAIHPRASLPDLTAALDLGQRQDRYAASLAYVLGARLAASGGDIDAQLQELGARILSRFRDDGGESEESLRGFVTRLSSSSEPEVTKPLAASLVSAFNGALEASFDSASATWTFDGPAAETATMLTELASMQAMCKGREGTVRVGQADVPVTVIEYEVCTHSPYERCRPGVDPRNWPAYSPFFFQSVEVLTPAPTSVSWQGVIQESVGALITGTPVITNLAVSYLEQPGLAVTSYDLAPDDPRYKPDDGTVTVDYGMFAVIDEGAHRRIRMLKVVHIDGKALNHHWLCPLWAKQLAMIGWWF